MSLRLPRGQCADFKKVFTVRAPWEGRSRGLTQEFEAFALMLITGATLGEAASADREGPCSATAPGSAVISNGIWPKVLANCATA
jgi:hypothetical protein